MLIAYGQDTPPQSRAIVRRHVLVGNHKISLATVAEFLRQEARQPGRLEQSLRIHCGEEKGEAAVHQNRRQDSRGFQVSHESQRLG